VLAQLSIANVHEASQTLEALQCHKAQLRAEALALVAAFDREYGAPPAALVLMRGRGLVWRRRSSTPQAQSVFALCGDVGQAFLADLPLLARRTFLDYEKRRLILSTELRITNYQIRLVDDALRTHRIIGSLASSLGRSLMT